MERKYALWIVGDSGTGKSDTVESWGSHLTSKGSILAKEMHSNVDLLLFDDLELDKIENYKEWIQSKTPFTFKSKWYEGKWDAGIPHGKVGVPCVFTTNYDPLASNNKGIDMKWFKTNVMIVYLGKSKMYLDYNEEDKIYQPKRTHTSPTMKRLINEWKIRKRYLSQKYFILIRRNAPLLAQKFSKMKKTYHNALRTTCIKRWINRYTRK